MGKRPARVILFLCVPLLLAACGQPDVSPAPVVPPDPYANGASHPWSYIAPDDKNPALTLAPGENVLRYETMLRATNGWGPIEVDASNGGPLRGDGRTLGIGGNTYARGLGVHAGSEMRFGLDAPEVTCTRFSAQVGVDDEVGARGSVTFRVYLDGTEAYDSGPMRGQDSAKPVELDLSGKQELRLVVTDGGDGIRYDHADWAEPTVVCAATPPLLPGPVGPSGALDPSFDASALAATPYTAALAPGGKVIVAAGGLLTRLNADGSPDSSFGVDGRVEPAHPFSPFGERVVVQPDGKVILGVGADDWHGLIRYNTDGSPDPGFGQGGQVAFFGVQRAVPLPFSPRGLALQPDGKLLVAGTGVGEGTEPGFIVMRFGRDGRVDPAFGRGGVVVTTFGGPSPYENYTEYVNSIPAAIELAPNGKFHVAGYSFFEDPVSEDRANVLSVARYLPDGTLDPAYSGDGKVGSPLLPSGRPAMTDANAIALQGDGKLVAVGTSLWGTECPVARIGTDGSFDGGFGVGGVVDLAAEEGNCLSLKAVKVQRSGGVLVSGSVYSLNGEPLISNSFFRRLNPDGTVDETFEVGPAQATDGGTILIQPDGRILVGTAGITRVFP